MSNQSIKLVTMTDRLGQIKAAIKQFEADAEEPKAYLMDYFKSHDAEVIKGHSFKSQFIIADRVSWDKEAIEALAYRVKISVDSLRDIQKTRYVRTDPLPSAFLDKGLGLHIKG